MSKPHRFGSAISLVALASMIVGCASGQNRVASGFGGEADGEVGLATRAMAALQANDVPTAITYAERAVAKTPNDAGFRALLGNAYFAAGRFWSAEAAYKDSLSIYSNQPQVVLRLALVEIALGKPADAIGFLEAARGVLDPADYGLALALAGQPAAAVDLLQVVARARGADARVRQNLALSYALAGDWTNARTVAAQDVPADQLDSRIQQWMQFAKPGRAADKVAGLIGVTPATVDPGQPIRLALHKPEVRQAQATPSPQPQVAHVRVPQPQAQPQVAPVPAPPPQFAEGVPAPQFAEAAPEPVAVTPAPPPPPPRRVPVREVQPPEPPSVPEFVTVSAPEAIYTAPAPKPVRAKAPVQRPAVRKAAMPIRRGNAKVVMQLGSYHTPQQVMAGWSRLTQRYPALRAYLPMRARFDSPKGTFWRLSVQGFGSQREAILRCQLLKSRGGKCFVRNAAGDAPVQIASR